MPQTAQAPPVKPMRITQKAAAAVLDCETTASGIEVYTVPSEFGRVPIYVSVPWDAAHSPKGNTRYLLCRGSLATLDPGNGKARRRAQAASLAQQYLQERANRAPACDPVTGEQRRPGESRQMRLARERRRRGLCWACAKPAEAGYSRCRKHRLRSQRQARARVSARREKDRCVQCGKPSRGFSRCAKHREDAARRTAGYRARHRE